MGLPAVRKPADDHEQGRSTLWVLRRGDGGGKWASRQDKVKKVREKSAETKQNVQNILRREGWLKTRRGKQRRERGAWSEENL
jgi:hypothetical protein